MATPPREAGDRGSFFVSASDQESNGRNLLVDDVVITGTSGYVAVYLDGEGAPGRRVGVSKLLAAGEHQDVAVELDQGGMGGDARVHVMVHREDNGNETFDFPAGDAPAEFGPGIVVVPLDLAVEPNP